MRQLYSRAAAGLIGLLGATIIGMGAVNAAPVSVSLKVDTLVSDPGHIAGEFPGQGDTVFYAYTRDDGQTISDTIPVHICITDSSDLSGWASFKVTFDGNGQFPGTVTLPSDLTFLSSNGLSCQDVSVGINTGPVNLTDPNQAQNFTYNIVVRSNNSDSSPRNLAVNFNSGVQVIHLALTVLPAESNVSCYLTDSSGLILANCDGQPVNTDGRFVIVANKKKVEVATNPGQFYYNLIWKNRTGSAQNVAVQFTRTNLLAKGAQAIHAWYSNSYGAALSTNEFDEVNSIGFAEGSDDKITSITVPNGDSLAVTYHLSYAKIGQAVPVPCATTCGTADQFISVKADVTGGGISPKSCTSAAKGYLKSGT
jgi:hypothetical protein